MKLIDPATNLPSAETTTDIWRSVPTINDVANSGPDGQTPAWPPVVPPNYLQRTPSQLGSGMQSAWPLMSSQ